jgi:hypothetical protein
MPANVVKTARDEHLWEKAKKRAAAEGRPKDYAYVMGIFQRMKKSEGDSEPLRAPGGLILDLDLAGRLEKATANHTAPLNQAAWVRQPGAASRFQQRGPNPNVTPEHERYHRDLYSHMPTPKLMLNDGNYNDEHDVVKGLGFDPPTERAWAKRVRDWTNTARTTLDLKKALFSELRVEKSLPGVTRSELARRTMMLFREQRRQAGDFVVKSDAEGNLILTKATPVGRQFNGKRANEDRNAVGGPASPAQPDRIDTHPGGKGEESAQPQQLPRADDGDPEGGKSVREQHFEDPDLDTAPLDGEPEDAGNITAELERLHKQLHELHQHLEHTPGEIHLHNELVALMREVYAKPTPDGLREVRHQLHHFAQMVQGPEEGVEPPEDPNGDPEAADMEDGVDEDGNPVDEDGDGQVGDQDTDEDGPPRPVPKGPPGKGGPPREEGKGKMKRPGSKPGGGKPFGKSQTAGGRHPFDDALRKGGPYIGPKGGKWRDPQHKRPWVDPSDRKKRRIGDKAKPLDQEHAAEVADRIVLAMQDRMKRGQTGRGVLPEDMLAFTGSALHGMDLSHIQQGFKAALKQGLIRKLVAVEVFDQKKGIGQSRGTTGLKRKKMTYALTEKGRAHKPDTVEKSDTADFPFEPGRFLFLVAKGVYLDLDSLEKGAGHKYDSRKRVGDRWVYKYSDEKKPRKKKTGYLADMKTHKRPARASGTHRIRVELEGGGFIQATFTPGNTTISATYHDGNPKWPSTGKQLSPAEAKDWFVRVLDQNEYNVDKKAGVIVDGGIPWKHPELTQEQGTVGGKTSTGKDIKHDLTRDQFVAHTKDWTVSELRDAAGKGGAQAEAYGHRADYLDHMERAKTLTFGRKAEAEQMSMDAMRDFGRQFDAGGRPLKKSVDDDVTDLIKAANHKYMRRVPTGKKKPKYRYIYTVDSKHHDDEVHVGEKVQIAHGDQKGHYEVVKVKGDWATIRHDETGRELSIRKDHFHELFAKEHAQSVVSKYRELKKVAAAAMRYGSKKQKLRALKQVDDFTKRYDLPPFAASDIPTSKAEMPKAAATSTSAQFIDAWAKANAALAASFTDKGSTVEGRKKLRDRAQQLFLTARKHFQDVGANGTDNEKKAAVEVIAQQKADIARILQRDLQGEAKPIPTKTTPPDTLAEAHEEAVKRKWQDVMGLIKQGMTRDEAHAKVLEDTTFGPKLKEKLAKLVSRLADPNKTAPPKNPRNPSTWTLGNWRYARDRFVADGALEPGHPDFDKLHKVLEKIDELMGNAPKTDDEKPRDVAAKQIKQRERMHEAAVDLGKKAAANKDPKFLKATADAFEDAARVGTAHGTDEGKRFAKKMREQARKWRDLQEMAEDKAAIQKHRELKQAAVKAGYDAASMKALRDHEAKHADTLTPFRQPHTGRVTRQDQIDPNKSYSIWTFVGQGVDGRWTKERTLSGAGFMGSGGKASYVHGRDVTHGNHAVFTEGYNPNDDVKVKAAKEDPKATALEGWRTLRDALIEDGALEPGHPDFDQLHDALVKIDELSGKKKTSGPSGPSGESDKLPKRTRAEVLHVHNALREMRDKIVAGTGYKLGSVTVEFQGKMGSPTGLRPHDDDWDGSYVSWRDALANARPGQQLHMQVRTRNENGEGLLTTQRITIPEMPKTEKPKKTPGKKTPGKKPAGAPTSRKRGGKGSEIRHKEVGEHVWGARKDLASLKTKAAAGKLEVSDLDGVSFSDAARLVTKRNLFPTPSMKQLKEKGMSPGAAHMTLALHSLIGAKPPDSDEGRRLYTQSVRVIQGALDNVKTVADFEAFRQEVWHNIANAGRTAISHEEIKAMGLDPAAYGTDEKLEKREPGHVRIQHERAWQSGKGQQDNYYRIDKVKRANAQLAWASLGTRFLQQLSIGTLNANKNRVMATGDMINMHSTYSGGPPSGGKQWETALRAARKYDDHEDGWKAVAEGSSKGGGGTGGKRKGTGRVSIVQQVAGTPIRKGGTAIPKEASGERMAKTFGFSNLDHGNWMTDADREHHLHHAEGAFHDLADVLGITPDTVSLKGRLAVHFGARGSGGKGAGAAHYEAGSKVMNITKFAGAGSVAHEWGHFLDNVMADVHLEDTGSAAGQFITEKYGQVAHRNSDDPKARRLASAVKKVLSVIENGDPDQAGQRRASHEKRRLELKARLDRDGELHQAYRAANQKVLEAKQAGASADELKRLRDKAEAAREDYNDAVTAYNTHIKTNARLSHYMQDAKALDGTTRKEYFADTKEMFARAFESYVEDTLKSSGRENSYLVDGTQVKYATDRLSPITTPDGKVQEAQPYPQGKERKLINAALKELLDVIREDGHLHKALDWLDDLLKAEETLLGSSAA